MEAVQAPGLFFVGEVLDGIIGQLLEECLQGAFGELAAAQQHVADLIDDIDKVTMLGVDDIDPGDETLIPDKGFHVLRLPRCCGYGTSISPDRRNPGRESRSRPGPSEPW